MTKTICLVYHESNFTNIYSRLVRCWLRYHRLSRSQSEPILITDNNSDTSFWPLSTIKCEIPHFDPPASSDRHANLYKCAWLKSRCFDLVGPCVVIEPDALLLRNIDDLFDLDCGMAMCQFHHLDDRYKVPNITTHLMCQIQQWKTNDLILGKALMGGVQFHNVSISEMYEHYFNRRQEDWICNSVYNNGAKCGLAITEFIFSIICSQIGTIIPHEYNWLNMWGDHPEETRVLHFAGDLSCKQKMLDFARSRII